MNAPSLELLKVQLDGAPGSLRWWGAALPTAGGWNWRILKVFPTQAILWFYDKSQKKKKHSNLSRINFCSSAITATWRNEHDHPFLIMYLDFGERNQILQFGARNAPNSIYSYVWIYMYVAENTKLSCHFLMYFNLGNASESITGTYHFFYYTFLVKRNKREGI